MRNQLRPTSRSPIRVAALTGHPVVSAGLSHLIGDHPRLQLVGTTDQPSEATGLITTTVPDVILLDPDSYGFRLHKMDGLARITTAKILVFTAVATQETYRQTIALGGAGVILKRDSGDIVLRAIEKVHSGEMWLNRGATAYVMRGLLTPSDDPDLPKIQLLTARERQVIRLIGSGLKNPAIAERLSISKATVRNHLTSILGKLHLTDRFELVFFAFRHRLADVDSGRRDLPNGSLDLAPLTGSVPA